MCICQLQGKNVPIKVWTQEDTIEPQAREQLENIAKLPWVFSHIAVMPDVHFGKGATVGSVIAMKDAVSPSAVGVDIGCGMMATKTNLKASDLPESLKELRAEVEKNIPVGFAQHPEAVLTEMPATLLPRIQKLVDRFHELNPKVLERFNKMLSQIGTLGGGNHFIELCIDTEQNVWMMLHSGSRNIGKELAEIHIGIAKTLSHNAGIPDPDLAVFLSNTEEMEAYRHDLMWAQEYAYINRIVMMELYKQSMQKFFPQMRPVFEVICHHNYVSEETHFGEDVIVTRKGAISARQGQYGIIPGSMGAKSFIVKGKGNPESFQSASHGAGRKHSRNQAKKLYSLEDLARETQGVECRKDKDVLDEIPSAYKDIEQVMANQSDLVEIVAELKQVMCIKG